MKKIIPGTRVQTNWRYARHIESMFLGMNVDPLCGKITGVSMSDKNVAEVEITAPSGEKFKTTFHKDWLDPVVTERRKICKTPSKPKRK